MKRNHFSSFLFGMIAVTLWSIWVFAINTSYFKNDGSLDFSQLKSTANGNKLTQAMRDSLIEGLSRQNTSNASIPAGAVMAFNLTSCPDGWRRFSEADGRFIMGTSNNIRSRGGTGSIMMKANQLADHSHFFTDIFYSENGRVLPNWIWVNAAGMFMGNLWYRWPWSSATDGDNNPIAIVRKTWGYILPSAWSHANSYLHDWPQTRSKSDADRDIRFQRPEKQQPLNILNPYVKLLYCQKN